MSDLIESEENTGQEKGRKSLLNASSAHGSPFSLQRDTYFLLSLP
jgi:hypothetical protein